MAQRHATTLRDVSNIIGRKTKDAVRGDNIPKSDICIPAGVSMKEVVKACGSEPFKNGLAEAFYLLF